QQPARSPFPIPGFPARWLSPSCGQSWSRTLSDLSAGRWRRNRRPSMFGGDHHMLRGSAPDWPDRHHYWARPPSHRRVLRRGTGRPVSAAERGSLPKSNRPDRAGGRLPLQTRHHGYMNKAIKSVARSAKRIADLHIRKVANPENVWVLGAAMVLHII